MSDQFSNILKNIIDKPIEVYSFGTILWQWNGFTFRDEAAALRERKNILREFGENLMKLQLKTVAISSPDAILLLRNRTGVAV
ncbi:MAG: hypothetical protein WD767_10090 [Alphaproteobacteria bacterium]